MPTQGLRKPLFSTIYLRWFLMARQAAICCSSGCGPGDWADGSGPGHGGECAAEVVESGSASARECAAGLCATEQRLSSAGNFSPLSPAVDAAGMAEKRRFSPVKMGLIFGPRKWVHTIESWPGLFIVLRGGGRHDSGCDAPHQDIGRVVCGPWGKHQQARQRCPLSTVWIDPFTK
jgi:hypothetical protein